MSETALRLRDELLRLPEEERLELARTLWDSIERPDDEIDQESAAWIDELNRRAADLDAGRATVEPVDKVFADLREEALRERSKKNENDRPLLSASGASQIKAVV